MGRDLFLAGANNFAGRLLSASAEAEVLSANGLTVAAADELIWRAIELSMFVGLANI